MIGLLKGLQATISHMLTRKVTVQYPEERRHLPERSRGLIRLRLRDDGVTPRCISCTFCEQTCPGTAIKVSFKDSKPGQMMTFDAGAGPMLAWVRPGSQTLELGDWLSEGDGPLPPARGSCLAASLIDAETLTPKVLARMASRNGVWLSQTFAVASYYDQLGPGAPGKTEALEYPEEYVTVEGCPPVVLGGFAAGDPADIGAYGAAGGFRATVEQFASMTPAELVEEITISGLRGRGGGGYLTGAKWREALEAEAPRKYVICNASEGDLDSYKDRVILENSPFRVIEGMMAAAWAIGAREGIVYIESRYARAVERLEAAIAAAREEGLLDAPIEGTGFEFSITVLAVPDAYAGGEETALLETIEGRRPMPRVRPPYPSRSGLYGLPTIVENVETLAALPWIMANGAREFQQIGAEHAPGTRLFALSGAVARPGLYEAPMNWSLKKLAEAAGGLTADARAALIGAPGGGFISPGLFDIPLDFDSIAETGGNLSSGTIRVIGDGTCIVQLARECLSWSASQACGKCVPDRLGTRRLLEIVDRICNGKGTEEDLALAQELAHDIADGSLCGLGRGAVRPLLTGLEFFQQEFKDHIGKGGACKSGRCALK
ncbi:MAG: NADH-quinone oxidoreductase subunit F [Gaiellales bacterium]|nr:MAG: NADH-quinone oxidoreductase subunit F [Gaiellales bacterium]